ncbi:MAG: helix-turn-helix transcriptional regulator, partial [Ilumatobacteraceae bacterium]
MPGLHELTSRENDVLGAMADGLSNDAIARKLHLAAKTIESVIRSIFIKLDILGSADENRRVRAVRIF